MNHVVHFLPDNIKITVDENENLLTAAANAGVYIHAFCGGDGVCGKCKVIIELSLYMPESAQLMESTCREHSIP